MVPAQSGSSRMKTCSGRRCLSSCWEDSWAARDWAVMSVGVSRALVRIWTFILRAIRSQHHQGKGCHGQNRVFENHYDWGWKLNLLSSWMYKYKTPSCIWLVFLLISFLWVNGPWSSALMHTYQNKPLSAVNTFFFLISQLRIQIWVCRMRIWVFRDAVNR